MRKPDLAEGDLVRFLNDKLEGRIARILPGERAVVEIEDGFPVETVFSELVRIAPAAIPVPTANPTDTGAYILLPPSSYPLDAGIHLLMVPYPGKINSGPWQVQLHNPGNVPVLFSVFFETPLNKKSSTDYGTLTPGSMLFMGDTNAGQVSFEIALMIHDQSLDDSRRFFRKRFTATQPGIKARFPELDSPYCFSTSLCIYRNTETEKPVTLDSEQARKIKEALSGSLKAPMTTSAGSTLNRGAELIVDLHIESITSGKVPKNEKQHLELQLKHFKKELDRAMLDSYPVVFFIHGVGNGILRKAIRYELDTLGIRYSDGPSERFGQGATKVTL